ncbi:hypothetical protein ASF53_15075 [Methylobacterium sp. Leaf123]|uniref:hypothetical protein n=1 Tax=Methylobacterium sp. Leaf123 TaxID=1736264 RepID=UPI0006F7C4BE|nr:hypothetical protein [Methylobacterium sp. Leaf123]KQQ11987.1 hypothetical protein ASF53_15075 [Methylobacterium sp. Leaf123]
MYPILVFRNPGQAGAQGRAREVLLHGAAGIRALAQGLFEGFKERGIHVATVAGFVSPGSGEAEEVAERYWQRHSEPKDGWSPETVDTP